MFGSHMVLVSPLFVFTDESTLVLNFAAQPQLTEKYIHNKAAVHRVFTVPSAIVVLLLHQRLTSLK
jgi:hypothetical protein